MSGSSKSNVRRMTGLFFKALVFQVLAVGVLAAGATWFIQTDPGVVRTLSTHTHALVQNTSRDPETEPPSAGGGVGAILGWGSAVLICSVGFLLLVRHLYATFGIQDDKK